MAGTITPSTVAHNSRGVVKIGGPIVADNGGLLRPFVVGAAFGRLVGVAYKPGTLGAGGQLTVADQTGASIFSMADLGTTAFLKRPTQIITDNVGAAVTAATTAQDVNREIIVAGKLSVSLQDAVVGLPTVTLTDAGDVVNSTAHGLVAGDCFMFDTITTSTGISIDVPYFVIAAGLTANAFTFSATRGGSAQTLTTDGSATAHKVPVFADTTTCDYDLAGGSSFITNTAHGLVAGDTVVFIRETGGTLKPALLTPYLVMTHGLAATTFEVSALEAGQGATIGGTSFAVTGSDLSAVDFYKVGAGAANGAIYLIVDESSVGPESVSL